MGPKKKFMPAKVPVQICCQFPSALLHIKNTGFTVSSKIYCRAWGASLNLNLWKSRVAQRIPSVVYYGKPQYCISRKIITQAAFQFSYCTALIIRLLKPHT